MDYTVNHSKVIWMSLSMTSYWSNWISLVLQDVTHKVVEAIGTIAGSSLEQTTWLRRNLEVKASPQIIVDGANLETDVEGVLLTSANDLVN